MPSDPWKRPFRHSFVKRTGFTTLLTILYPAEIVKAEFHQDGMYIPDGKLGRLASKREHFPFEKRQMEEGTI